MSVEQSVFDKRHSTSCLRLHTTGTVYVTSMAIMAARRTSSRKHDSYLSSHSRTPAPVFKERLCSAGWSGSMASHGANNTPLPEDAVRSFCCMAYPSPGGLLRALAISAKMPQTCVRFGLRRYPCAADAAVHEAGVAFPRMREAAAAIGSAAQERTPQQPSTRSPATAQQIKEALQGRRPLTCE